MRLDKHPILMQGHNVIQAIEECGASEKLTRAVILAGELMNEVEKLVDRVQAYETGLATDILNTLSADLGGRKGWEGH